MKLSDFSTLQEARDYTEVKERMVSLDMLVSLLTEHDCVDTLEQSTDAKAKGLWLAINSGVSEFNLMNSHPIGQKQQQLLVQLVSTGALSQGFADAVVGYANSNHQPYKNVTLHLYQIERGTVPFSEKITIESNYAVISTTQSCELHNPRLMAYNPRLGKWQRIENFRKVSNKGVYETVIPSYAKGWSLKVDNSYGVI